MSLPPLSLYSVQAFAVGGVALGLLGLVGSSRSFGWRPGVGPIIGVATLLGIGTGSLLIDFPSGLTFPAFGLAGMLLLMLSARTPYPFQWMAACQARTQRSRGPWLALMFACSALTGLAVFGADRPGGEASSLVWPAPWQMPAGTAHTDRGHSVGLARGTAGAGPAEQLHDQEVAELQALGLLSRRVLQAAPASWTYNCHGWIFTDGRYLLPDVDVELVLQDNGYYPVPQPQVGDLAIYRQDGAVCHSAIVSSVGDDGFILLQSKWAWMGRFYHLPNATPYGLDVAYYHSPRRGHLLQGLDGSGPSDPSAVSLLATHRD